VPFVGLIEQDGGDTLEIGIIDDTIDEDRLGNNQHAGSGGNTAIKPGLIANGLAGPLAEQLCHAFGSCTRRDSPRRGENDLPCAPILVQQGGRDSGGFARAWRSD